MSRHPVRTLLQRTPLRVALVVAVVLLAAIGLSVTGTVVTTQLRGYLVQQVDDDLAGEIPPSLTRPGPRGDDSPFGPGRPEWLRVTTTNGVPIFADSQTGPSAPPPHISRAQVLSAGKQPFTVTAAAGDEHWRVGVQRAVIRDFGEVLAVRAISLGDVEGTVHRLVLLETLVGLLVLLLLGGLAYVVVRTSLRPLQEVEVTAAEIAAGDLTQRVPESDARTEVGRLSRAFNTMVSQIETAFRAREASEALALASEERMRRFVADASHELRTPLTSIRGFAELYRQGAVPDPENLDRVMRRVEDEATRMGLLVDDLLVLARLDQQRPLELGPVDLLEVAGDVVHDAQVLAPDRTIGLDLHGEGAPVVLGDEARLRQVVTNLVSNALTHTPAGTPVSVSLEVTEASDGGPDRVLLAVADQGHGMTEEARARVFERFYRADPSRTRAGGGSGLGLSIVAALVAAHGGRVGVQSAPGGGSRFLVELPQYQGNQVVDGSQAGHRLSGEDEGHSSPAAASDVPR